MALGPAEALALVRPADVAGGPDDLPFEFVDPETPHIGILDLGVTRGDGVFETIGCVFGHPQALDAHLARFAASASALELPPPDPVAWRGAILAVCSVIADHAEGSVKTVLTRGVDGAPTGWVHGTKAPDFSRERVSGVSVVTLDRGFRHDIGATAPWLLQGAKTLSYAVNTAALREAQRRGADDVIFISSDGYVLEGPTSTVLLRRGGRLITPGTGLAILDGTTQTSAFRFAADEGLDSGFEVATVAQLLTADAVWLLSSVRHEAPVTSIDGQRMAIDTGMTARLNAYLAARID